MDRSSYAKETLERAITILGDVRADTEDREDAGRVIAALLVRACPTERDLSELLTTLGRSLHVRLAVSHVLCPVQWLPLTVREKAAHGIERLMERSFRDGDYDVLTDLILIVLANPLWAPRIHDEWGKASVIWAINHVPESPYPANVLVQRWLHALERVPTWMIELVGSHPDLVTSTLLLPKARWQLHCAAPTVAGWHHLAGVPWVSPVVEPALFGSEADVAEETLRQALGETTAEKTRAILRRWLHELTGEVP